MFVCECFSSLFYLEQKISAITLTEQVATRFHKLKGLPPNSPLAMEGHKGETMKRLASADAIIENTSTTETREYFSVYDNHLV